MKIKFILSLLIILAINTSAQVELYKSHEGLSDYYSEHFEMIKKMDEDHFMMITSQGDSKYLQKLNRAHEQIFNIELIETGYHSYFEYLPESNEIFIIEYEPFTITGTEKFYKIWASFYHSETGELKSRVDLVPSAKSLWSVGFSQDKSHFAFWAVEEGLYSKIFRTNGLKHLGDINFQPGERDNYFSRCISNEGNVLLMHQTESDEMRFNFYNQKGELVKSEHLTNPMEKKTKFAHTRIATSSDGLAYAVGLKKQKKNYLGLISWRIDLNALSVSQHADIPFDKTSMQEHLYQRVYPSSDKNKPEKMAELQKNKAPGKLKSMTLNKAKIDVDGNLIVVMSHEFVKVKSKGGYYFDQYNGYEIYAISIDPLGKTNWGTVIDRWVKYISMGNPFRPGFSGVTSHVHVGENDLSLINFENKAISKNVTILRKLDLKTGELVQAVPLFEEKNLIINTNLIGWLTEQHVVCLAKLSASNEISSEVMRLKTIDVN